MHPGFSLQVDRKRNLIRIVLTGLFMPDDVTEFLKARHEAHARLTCAPGQHVTLTDLRAIKILPQVTVDAWSAHLADPRTSVRRLAFVVAPTLVRAQLMRALVNRDAGRTRCFTDPAEAETWLLDDGQANWKSVSTPNPPRNTRRRFSIRSLMTN